MVILINRRHWGAAVVTQRTNSGSRENRSDCRTCEDKYNNSQMQSEMQKDRGSDYLNRGDDYLNCDHRRDRFTTATRESTLLLNRLIPRRKEITEGGEREEEER